MQFQNFFHIDTHTPWGYIISMAQDPIVTKINRVKGQLDGIVRMYEDERQCVDVVRQIIAARNSLSTIARELLTDEASSCSKERRTEDLENILKEIFKY